METITRKNQSTGTLPAFKGIPVNKSGLSSEKSIKPAGEYQAVNSFPIKASYIKTDLPSIGADTRNRLQKLVERLLGSFDDPGSPYSAVQFLPMLRDFEITDKWISEQLKTHYDGRIVLMDNELLKVVLINWEPGVQSSIHGHPAGGCVFKVLQGTLQEKRYQPVDEGDLLATCHYAKGSVAYLDDTMAYHAVGNPGYGPALSIHAYTPGRRKGL